MRILLVKALIFLAIVFTNAQSIQSDNNKKPCNIKSDGTIMNNSNVSVGYIKSDGTIKDAKNNTIGYIQNDGTIKNYNSNTVGYIMADGTVKDQSSNTLGYIKDDGTVQSYNTNTIGYAKDVNKRWAAVAFFFFRQDEASKKQDTNSGISGKATGKIEVGSLVAAYVKDNYYYACIVSIKGTSIEVKDLNGNINLVTKEDLMAIPQQGTKYLEGDKVFAVWPNDGKFYYGVLGKTDQKGAYVKWNDGSTDSYVEFEKMMKENISSDEVSKNQSAESETFGKVTGKIEEGSLVAAYISGSHYYAYIVSIKGINVLVKELNGSKSNVTKENLIAIPSLGTKYQEGDKVYAVWPDDGKFYYGILGKTDEKGAYVKWDDGSPESYVEFVRMIKK